MQKKYYSLWEPFFGGIFEEEQERSEMDERIENSKAVDITEPISGPYLRYDYKDDGKDVKLFFTGRRSCVFEHVGGPIELIFADGRVEEITGNRINIPDPIPCCAETWRDWKEHYWQDDTKDILIFENGIVVLKESWWDGVDSYHMSAYREGDLIARFNGYFPFEKDRSFYEEMLNSDDAQPFVDEMAERDRRLMEEKSR